MFVQIVEGQVSDVEAMRAQMYGWVEELAAGAEGWLGTTVGVTSDGRFIAAARFESAQAAQRNSDRPEQDAWWQRTAAIFDGESTFAESEQVTLFRDGGDDSAGFVQFMRMRVLDGPQLEAIDDQLNESIGDNRPDLLGGYHVWLDDDEMVAVNYFTSEAAAREGESQPMPAEAQEVFEQWQSLVSDVRWYDLTDPWIMSPG